MHADFSKLCDDYWQHLLDTDPAIGRSVGDGRLTHLLCKESLSDFQSCYEAAQSFKKRLLTIPPSELTENESRSYHLLQRELSNTVQEFEFERHLRHEFFPFTPDFRAVLYLNDTSLLSRQDVEDYLQRLRSIPALFQDIEQRVLEGCNKDYRIPAIHLQPVINSPLEQSRQPVRKSGFFKPLVGSMASRYSDLVEKAELIISEEIYSALANWSQFVEKQLGQYTTGKNSLSESDPDYYRYLVEKETLCLHSAEEIHQIGLQEVAHIQTEMECVARKAGFTQGADELKEHLAGNADYLSESAQALNDTVSILSKKIDGMIPEYFNLIPRISYGIKSIDSETSASMPPAFAQPNPANNSRAGVHWLTSLPDKCPSYMHTPLALHEAWPGHLMHIAILQELEGIPEFQLYRPLEYNAYIEGWALYCERLGHDMGLYDEPIDHFGQLQMEMWRATRLVVDTGIHFYGWSRERANKYMQTYLSLSEATIAAEVDRYIGMPAQALSYKMGDICIQQLREKSETDLGERFCLREFHRQLMICGPVTLNLLDQHITNWVESVKAEKG
ncbi:DUF885 family protein [Endozoicomonas sp. OPT23]|uniref:DUF885 domain-containing protein n=1 Tax=Endozoicomonas sp. OPT23 TaxID=2072845 RepID=UPI0018919615|nr:DUF885 domain-containing protein [Endozoicomonas sp. OPT23]